MATCEYMRWSACLCVCKHLRHGLSSAWRCEVIGALGSDWSNTQHAAQKCLIKKKTGFYISMTLHTLMTLKVLKFKMQFFLYYILLFFSHVIHFPCNSADILRVGMEIWVNLWIRSSCVSGFAAAGWARGFAQAGSLFLELWISGC